MDNIENACRPLCWDIHIIPFFQGNYKKVIQITCKLTIGRSENFLYHKIKGTEN